MSAGLARWRTTVAKGAEFFQNWIVPLFGACIFTVANLFVKLSITKERPWLMYVAYGLAVAAYWVYRQVCLTKGLAVAEGIIGSFITVTTVAVGLFFLRETLTPKQMAGLALIVVGLFLIQ